MKRSTAISRLAGVAAELERSKLWPGPAVVAGYIFGGMLQPVGEVERVQIALAVDEPAEDVPWLSHPTALEALASLLRLDKLPMAWWWRPVSWPIWNHEISRAVRFWSAAAGLDQEVFDALTAGRIDQLQFDEPSDVEQLVKQLFLERDVGRRHLADAVAGFYDREWRREHTGDGVYPGDHLWWAAAGYLDFDNAVKAFGH